jgi:hypothetical protein
LGKGQEHIQDQAAHGGCAIKLLGDADKGDVVRLEDLHEPGKIEERATEAVELIDQHDIDRAGGNVLQEPLQRGPVQVAAAVAAVIVALKQRAPTLLLLAGNVGLCSFPYCRWNCL